MSVIKVKTFRDSINAAINGSEHYIYGYHDDSFGKIYIKMIDGRWHYISRGEWSDGWSEYPKQDKIKFGKPDIGQEIGTYIDFRKGYKFKYFYFHEYLRDIHTYRHLLHGCGLEEIDNRYDLNLIDQEVYEWLTHPSYLNIIEDYHRVIEPYFKRYGGYNG